MEFSKFNGIGLNRGFNHGKSIVFFFKTVGDPVTGQIQCQRDQKKHRADCVEGFKTETAPGRISPGNLGHKSGHRGDRLKGIEGKPGLRAGGDQHRHRFPHRPRAVSFSHQNIKSKSDHYQVK